LEGDDMSLSVKDIAGALKLELPVVERLAKYLYPNKILLTNDEALVLRDYYYKFGGGPAGVEVGPYNEWMKLERMKALVKARLDMIEEKQSSCVTKLNGLAGSGLGTGAGRALPALAEPVAKAASQRGHDSVLKFPAGKVAVKSAPVKEPRRVALFGGR
jgi:hypothetical protein